MTAPVDHGQLTGLHCPACGEALNSRLVAKSFPMPGGHYRRRYCSCGADVVSFERVVGADITIMAYTGLDASGKGGSSDLSMVKRLIERLGGKVVKI